MLPLKYTITFSTGNILYKKRTKKKITLDFNWSIKFYFMVAFHANILMHFMESNVFSVV